MTKKLWELFEAAKLEEYNLERQMEDKDNHYYFKDIERSTQNGIANGILRSIEVLENDKHRTWQKAFEIHCKVRGIEVNTKFGFWTPSSKTLPPKNDTYMVTLDGGICGLDEPIVGMCGYKDGKWDEEGYVLAWMPLPEEYKESE